MEKKFQIKLKNNRILGPFDENQMEILYKQKKFEPSFLCKEFPKGNWEEAHKILRFLSDQEYTSPVEDSDLDSKKFIIPKDESLDYDLNKDNIEETEEVRLDAEEEANSLSSENDEDYKDDDEDDGVFSENTNYDKTYLIENVKDELDEQNTKKNDVKDDNKALDTIEKKEIISFDEKTKEVSIQDLIDDLKNDIENSEKVFDESVLNEDNESSDDDEEDPLKDEIEKEQNAKKNSRKKVIQVGFGIFFLFFFFSEIFEEKKVVTIETPIKIKRPVISFPFQKEYEDFKKSREFFAKGIESYKKGTYISKISAANFFNLSLSHKFRENEALGFLVLVYSELLPNSKNPEKAGNTLFKIINLGRNKLLNDSNMVIGTTHFYLFFEKKLTALNTIENFLRVKKPDLNILGLYLHVLVKAGQLEKASKAYKKIIPLKKNWDYKIFKFVSEYFELNQDFNSGQKILEEGIKNYPKKVSLRLEILKYYLRSGDIKSFERTLGYIRRLDAGKSPYFYSLFLENMGLRSILRANTQKDVKKKDAFFKEAAKYFNKALKIKESTSLRARLATLAVKGEDVVKNLIIRSKIIDFMKQSEKAMKEKKWSEALTLGVKAVDLSDSFIPPHLLLAKIQIKRGYHKSAIKRLEDLRNDFPKNIEVNQALINAYINSYKLDSAKNELDIMLNKREFQNFVSTSEYPALLANYYLKKKDYQNAIKNLNKSIKINPLKDETIFRLAEVYLLLRKYPNARMNLSKAIALDPLNVDYKVLWAKILYELESSDTAIGYLRDLLKEHPDNPKVLADIAIYYYKSGQLNQFENQKQKIESMAQTDPSFYKFLIKSATIEDKQDDVISYAKKLLNIYPGNLETRMLLAELYFKRKEFKKSLNEFKELKEWLPSFPKVNFSMAKGYLAAGNFKKAKEFAEEEMKLNPNSEFGFLMAGKIFSKEREKARDKNKILNFARKSIGYYEKALRINPRSVEALIGLGKIKLGQGKYNEAVDLYKRANNEDLSNASIYKLLGEAYTARGELGFAIESYKNYLEVNKLAPDKQKIQDIIKRLK